MAQKGDLLSFRPDIKVLDATIRDGGLVNDFYFTDEFIKALYKANVKAGVEFILLCLYMLLFTPQCHLVNVK